MGTYGSVVSKIRQFWFTTILSKAARQRQKYMKLYRPGLSTEQTNADSRLKSIINQMYRGWVVVQILYNMTVNTYNQHHARDASFLSDQRSHASR